MHTLVPLEHLLSTIVFPPELGDIRTYADLARLNSRPCLIHYVSGGENMSEQVLTPNINHVSLDRYGATFDTVVNVGQTLLMGRALKELRWSPGRRSWMAHIGPCTGRQPEQVKIEFKLLG